MTVEGQSQPPRGGPEGGPMSTEAVPACKVLTAGRRLTHQSRRSRLRLALRHKNTLIGSAAAANAAAVLEMALRSCNYSRCRGCEIRGLCYLRTLPFCLESPSVSIMLNYRAASKV